MSTGMVVVALLLIIFFFATLSASERMTSPEPGYVYDSGVPGPCIGILTGVHGNEPAGSIILEKMIRNGFFSQIKRGSVRVIYAANPVGLRLGIRGRFWAGDLNRTFKYPLTDADAIAIDKFFEPCDLIIDFHEGWGFHQLQPESLGSTVMANTDASNAIAQLIVQDLNRTVQMSQLGPKKSFLVLPPEQSCDIPTTYSCYLRRQIRLPPNLTVRHHILVETSGQNDVQPMEIRHFQIYTLIMSLLTHVLLF
jgi:hypothetical protein